MEQSRLRLALLVGAFFVMACSCRGCFLSNYRATIYAEDGETVLGEGHASDAETAVLFACSEYCRAQADEAAAAACETRCVSREGPEIDVHWSGSDSFWDLVTKLLARLLKRSCQG